MDIFSNIGNTLGNNLGIAVGAAFDLPWRWVKHQLIPDMRRDREAMISTATAARRIIYGRTRVGGNMVYAETSGDQDQYLNIIVVFAGHIVDGFEEIWFNDQLVASHVDGWDIRAPFNNFRPAYDGYGGGSMPPVDGVLIELHDGTQTTASAGMLAATHGNWTADHKLLGCAYGYFRLTYDESIFAAGIPQIKAVIRGRKVYDPRTGLRAWSDNPALCIRDYMTMPVDIGGMGCCIPTGFGEWQP